MTLLVVWGAGGHARVVIDAIIAGRGSDRQIAIIDDDATVHGEHLLGSVVKGDRQWLVQQSRADCLVVPAIGNNRHRDSAIDWTQGQGFALASVLHPSAIVGLDAHIADGCFLAAGTIVNTAARLAAGAIVNTGASVDHDCVVGRSTHIGPGARLCGDVTLGKRVLVGVGASIAPGRRIGDDAIIGAGAAVIRDVPSKITVGGTPAKNLEKTL